MDSVSLREHGAWLFKIEEKKFPPLGYKKSEFKE